MCLPNGPGSHFYGRSGAGRSGGRNRVLSGKLKGQLIEGTSFAGYLYGADCTVGMKVIASISKYEDNASAAVYSYDRSNIIYIFVGLFLLMRYIIGGKKVF